MLLYSWQILIVFQLTKQIFKKVLAHHFRSNVLYMYFDMLVNALII